MSCISHQDYCGGWLTKFHKGTAFSFGSAWASSQGPIQKLDEQSCNVRSAIEG
jgi:hypothetical protein